MEEQIVASSRLTVRTVTVEHDCIAAVYGTRFAAEAVVLALAKSGFDMQLLSIIGMDHMTEEVVVGFLKPGDPINVWARTGAFWGEMSGTLSGAALLIMPGFGHLFAAGPLVGRVVCAMEGQDAGSSTSPLGAALYSIGIPKDKFLNYEKQLKSGKFIVIAHGSRSEVAASRKILIGEDHHQAASRVCCEPQSLAVGE